MTNLSNKSKLKIKYITLFISITIFYYLIRIFIYFPFDPLFVDIIFIFAFIMIVLSVKNQINKKLRIVAYKKKRDEYRKIETRKRTFLPIKKYIVRTIEKIFEAHSRKNEIISFCDEFKKYLEKYKNLNPLKYDLLEKELIEILKEKHPFQYFIIHPQAEIMRFLFKSFLDYILPKNIENLHKYRKKYKQFPTMEEIFNHELAYSQNIDISKMNEKLNLVNMEKLTEIIEKMQNIPSFKEWNFKFNVKELKEKFNDLFSSNELEKRKVHFLEDIFKSYKDLYSKFKLVEFFLAFLLEIDNPNFDPLKFKNIKFKNKDNYIKNFRKEVKQNSKWKIFLEFGEGRQRQIRNLEAHEELKLEKDIIIGWLKPPDPPLKVKEFNEYRILLTILLWKIYEIFNIQVPEKFIDNLIQF